MIKSMIGDGMKVQACVVYADSEASPSDCASWGWEFVAIRPDTSSR
jgi:hypothetical protein